MFASKPGMMPAPPRILRLAAFAFALALTGCANHPKAYQSSDATPPTRVAGYASVSVEDDGIPAQAPPPSRIRDIPDDPSEPYSRNYGGANPMAAAASQANDVSPARAHSGRAHEAEAVIPDDLPPAFRRQLAAAISVSQ